MKKLTIRNILVPIDFSQMSIQAINTAKRLASRFSVAIHLAHVRQFNYPAKLMDPVPPMVPFSIMPYEQNGEQTALEELKAVARKCGVSSATCHEVRCVIKLTDVGEMYRNTKTRREPL